MARKKKPAQRHNDVLFTATVRKELQNQRSAGLKQGVYAVCKVVLDKAVDPDKTAEEKLQDIISFVSVWGNLKSDSQDEDKVTEATEEPHEI